MLDYSRPLDLIYFGNTFTVQAGQDQLEYTRIREGASSTNCVATCCGTTLLIDHVNYDSKCVLLFPEVLGSGGLDTDLSAVVPHAALSIHDFPPEKLAALAADGPPAMEWDDADAAWDAANLQAVPERGEGSTCFQEMLAASGSMVDNLGLAEGAGFGG